MTNSYDDENSNSKPLCVDVCNKYKTSHVAATKENLSPVISK